MHIDLSSITRADGQNEAFGLISGIDAKSLIEGSLKPLKMREEELDAVLNGLSERGTALSDLYTLASSMSSYSAKLNESLDDKTVFVDGQRYKNEYIEIDPGSYAMHGAFSISNVQTAKAKTMLSTVYQSTDSKIEIGSGIFEFTSPSIIQMSSYGTASDPQQGNASVIENIDDIPDQLHAYASDAYKNFVQNGPHKDVSVTKVNGNLMISITSGKDTYRSEQIKIQNDMLGPDQMINFYNSMGNKAFSVKVSNVDLSSKQAIDSFSDNIENDINLVSIRFSAHPEKLQKTVLQTMPNDVTLISKEELKQIAVTGFATSWDNSTQSFIIKTEINGEIYVSSNQKGTFHQLEIGSIESDNRMTIDLSNNPLSVTNKSECDSLEDLLNDMFGIDKRKQAHIMVSNDETVSSLSEKINTSLTSIGIKSEIISLPSGEKSLMISSANTGIANSFLSLDDRFANLFTLTEKPRNASLYYNGNLIESGSNTIVNSDLDLNIKLLKDSGEKTFNVKVDSDVFLMQDDIKNLLNSFNKLRFFIAQQKEMDGNGQFVKTAILKDDRAMNILDSGVSSQINRTFPWLEGNSIQRVAEIGIAISEKSEKNVRYSHIELKEDDFARLANLHQEDMSELLEAFTKGISDLVEGCINTENGSLGIETRDLKHTIDRYYKDRIATHERVVAMRSSLVKRYADIENAVIQGNSILKIMELSEKMGDNNR